MDASLIAGLSQRHEDRSAAEIVMDQGLQIAMGGSALVPVGPHPVLVMHVPPDHAKPAAIVAGNATVFADLDTVFVWRKAFHDRPSVWF